MLQDVYAEKFIYLLKFISCLVRVSAFKNGGYMQEIDYLRLIAFLLSLNIVYQFIKDMKAAIYKCIENVSRR